MIVRNVKAVGNQFQAKGGPAKLVTHRSHNEGDPEDIIDGSRVV